MTEQTIEKEWSRLAEDDGSMLLEAHDYDLVIGGDNVSELKTNPTRISYSPAVNKAKNITLEVPPTSELENLDYLGEPLTLYIDEEVGFIGEIEEITTEQREGNDYSILANPPGKKLNGSDVERTASNEIFTDTLSKLIDKYNDFDGEQRQLLEDGQFTSSNIISIGGGVRGVSGSSGTLTFENVGTDASSIDTVNIKAYIPSTETLNVTINYSSGSTSESFTGLDKNRYGEWVSMSPSISESESYDIIFDMDSDTLLIDWISITNEVLSRETQSPQVEAVESDINFYDRSGSSMTDTISQIGEGLNNTGSSVNTRQITAWANDPFPEYGDDEFVDGKGGQIAYDETEIRWQPSSSDSLEEWGMFARVYPYEYFVNRNEDHTLGNSIYDDAWSGAASVSTTQVYNEDSSVEITGEAEKSTQWLYDLSPEDSNDDSVNGTRPPVDNMVCEGKIYFPGSVSLTRLRLQAGSFTDVDNTDGYQLEIDSNEVSLVKNGGENSGTLDSVSASVNSDEWVDWTLTIDEDGGVSVTVSDSSDTYSVSDNDEEHVYFGEFFVDSLTSTVYLDDMLFEAGNVNEIDLRVEIDGVSFDIGLLLSTIDYREWNWTDLVSYDFFSDWPDTWEGEYDTYIQAIKRNTTSFAISPLLIAHKEEKWNKSTDFDLEVHEPQGHLDYPPQYTSGDVFNNSVSFEPEISEENIFKADVVASIDNTTDVYGGWGISQVIDADATDFPDVEASDSIITEFSYPGVEHAVNFKLSSAGQRDTDSPRQGYQRQTLSDFDVDISTNDLEIVFDRSFSDNRLALMNNLATDSSVFFRWLGSSCEIFHRGQETTDINLRSENISSTVSIKDVYKSVEVIGLHNVRSGIIESTEAPSYVDKHKVIRTEDIERESDAINRAKRFLENHGSIEFKGNIETLPTFAPLGAEMDGSFFNHGQDMIIRNVSYRKNRTTIDLGFKKDVATELISLEEGSSTTKGKATDKGMTIPVGEDQI